jgi:ectoine hydroxylase-related dioxygenase (phytanoyl-CoA dioxygenase family)
MPKNLSDADVAHYRDHGYVSPFPVLSAKDVARLRGSLERYEQNVGHPIDFPEKSKSYLLFDWADELVHHPKIIDAVEDLIGPDILVYHSTTWIKEPKTPAYVSWHQDGKYFHLRPNLHVTAWIALSDVSVESGCMHVIPDSHTLGDLEHEDDLGEWNMIKRGQGIKGRFDRETGIPMPLKAGEMSLHHTDLVHCSRGNDGDDRRIGLGISFIPASVRQYGEPKATALLVRGRARPGEFEEEKRLDTEMSEEALANHAYSVDLFRARQDIGSIHLKEQRVG